MSWYSYFVIVYHRLSHNALLHLAFAAIDHIQGREIGNSSAEMVVELMLSFWLKISLSGVFFEKTRGFVKKDTICQVLNIRA